MLNVINKRANEVLNLGYHRTYLYIGILDSTPKIIVCNDLFIPDDFIVFWRSGIRIPTVDKIITQLDNMNKHYKFF